jgi:hypothetical protein
MVAPSASITVMYLTGFIYVPPTGIEPVSEHDRYINTSMKNCLNCATELTSPHARKFCSRSCSCTFNRNRLSTGRYAPKSCSWCGALTTNPKFCSKQCMGLAKVKYHTDESRLTAQRALGREAVARYHAKKKYQTPVDADLTAIKLFYANCPDGFEIDHIIPISKGGLHTLSNLQYLTKADNRSKSAKLDWCHQRDLNPQTSP